MATVLVLYGSSYGQTALIARNLATQMRTRGAEVIVYDLAALPRTLDISRYDALVLGGRVHGGRHPRKLVQFVRRNLAALQRMPSAFFSVSMVVAKPDGAGQKEAEEYVARFVAESGWRPQLTATFAGAIKYTKYNFFLRWIMKRIARSEGRATDTSRDHEYTDWGGVRRFADTIAAAVQPSVHLPLSRTDAHLPA